MKSNLKNYLPKITFPHAKAAIYITKTIVNIKVNHEKLA